MYSAALGNSKDDGCTKTPTLQDVYTCRWAWRQGGSLQRTHASVIHWDEFRGVAAVTAQHEPAEFTVCRLGVIWCQLRLPCRLGVLWSKTAHACAMLVLQSGYGILQVPAEQAAAQPVRGLHGCIRHPAEAYLWRLPGHAQRAHAAAQGLVTSRSASPWNSVPFRRPATVSPYLESPPASKSILTKSPQSAEGGFSGNGSQWVPFEHGYRALVWLELGQSLPQLT